MAFSVLSRKGGSDIFFIVIWLLWILVNDVKEDEWYNV